jgi:hypothetical protein
LVSDWTVYGGEHFGSSLWLVGLNGYASPDNAIHPPPNQQIFYQSQQEGADDAGGYDETPKSVKFVCF